MKVEYTLTPEDFAAAAYDRFQYPPGTPRWAQYRGIAAIVLAFLTQGAILVAHRLPWPLVAAVLLLGVLCFVVLPTLVFRRLIARAMRRTRLPGRSMSLEIRPEGLALTTATTASLTTWERIDRIVVRDTHAFFYGNDVATLILPRRVFAGERDFEEFVESARSYQEAAIGSCEAE